MYRLLLYAPQLCLCLYETECHLHCGFVPDTVKPFAPVNAFTSENPGIAVVGRNVTLRCFFYGKYDMIVLLPVSIDRPT